MKKKISDAGPRRNRRKPIALKAAEPSDQSKDDFMRLCDAASAVIVDRVGLAKGLSALTPAVWDLAPGFHERPYVSIAYILRALAQAVNSGERFGGDKFIEALENHALYYLRVIEEPWIAVLEREADEGPGCVSLMPPLVTSLREFLPWATHQIDRLIKASARTHGPWHENDAKAVIDVFERGVRVDSRFRDIDHGKASRRIERDLGSSCLNGTHQAEAIVRAALAALGFSSRDVFNLFDAKERMREVRKRKNGQKSSPA